MEDVEDVIVSSGPNTWPNWRNFSDRIIKPGDIVFFNNRGRGRVSHAGIYIGDDQFIHSSSHRSGGVRVDSLDDRYWNASYMEAKRVLAQVSPSMNASAQGSMHR